MKKALLVLTLATFTAAVFAQSTGSKFHFGVKATPSLAWIKTDPSGLNDGTPFGFGYGLITDFGFADRYAFSTGIEVAYRGGKTKEAIDTFIVSKSYSLQFIEVPLTLKLKTNEIGYLTYFFQVGIAPGYAIRTRADVKTEYTNKSTPTKSESNVDVNDDINNFNLSLIIAAGAEYNLSGNTSLLLGITFDNGFLDILAGPNTGRSNYLGLTVGILF